MGKKDRLDSNCKEKEGTDCLSLKSVPPPFWYWVPSTLEKGKFIQQYLRSVNLMGMLNAKEHTSYTHEWQNVV